MTLDLKIRGFDFSPRVRISGSNGTASREVLECIQCKLYDYFGRMGLGIGFPGYDSSKTRYDCQVYDAERASPELGTVAIVRIKPKAEIDSNPQADYPEHVHTSRQERFDVYFNPKKTGRAFHHRDNFLRVWQTLSAHPIT